MSKYKPAKQMCNNPSDIPVDKLSIPIGEDEVGHFEPSLYFRVVQREKTVKNRVFDEVSLDKWKTIVETTFEDVRIYNDEFAVKGSFSRGRLRAAEAFDVPIEQIIEATRCLNGRKVDGIYAADLMGRYGSANGTCYNRATVAANYGVSIEHVELATERLQGIIRKKDVKAAYLAYLAEMDTFADKERRDEVAAGE